MQILSIFPGFVLQQIQNALAVRQIVPRGVDTTDLNWTYIGFADDTPELRTHRLKQNNLVGPAGYVSMEDGCVGGFVQRGIAGAADEQSVLEMGGSGAETQETRAHRSLGPRLLEGVSQRTWGCDMGDADTLFRLAALNADYAACIDADRLEDWPESVRGPCIYKITTADNQRRRLRGRHCLRQFARACCRTGSRRCARPTSTSARAIATSSACRRFATGTAITAETPFLVVRTMRDGRMDLFAAGRLSRSRTARHAMAQLRFAERIVVCDSSRFDTLLAIPL